MSGAPGALIFMGEKLLTTAKEAGAIPVAFEIMFGPGSIERLDRGVLRTITGISQLHGLPVEFPEEPGPMERAVWLRIRTVGGGAGYLLTPELLNDTAMFSPPPAPPSRRHHRGEQ